ncbi:hypothetical protein NHQ30_003293 [Ciborinia camelliae]|nr:hypothetical protein NHQ30_003293 [Ciborinia camelliae]
MSPPEKINKSAGSRFNGLANELNQLRQTYGFNTSTITRITRKEDNTHEVTRRMSLDNRTKLPMTYKEERQFIDLRAKIRSTQAQDQKFADDFEAFVENEIKDRRHLGSKDQVLSVVSRMKVDFSSVCNDMAQLQLSGNNKLGTKRARDEDTEMNADKVGVSPRLNKRARNRAAKSVTTTVSVAASATGSATKSPRISSQNSPPNMVRCKLEDS